MEKLGFIAKNDLNDRTQWSGTITFLNDILSNSYQIIPIVVRKSLVSQVIEKSIKIITHNRVKRLRFMPIESFKYQKLILKASAGGCKLFFAPVASDIISHLKMPADTKLIYLSDATYHAMINYYFFFFFHDQNVGNFQKNSALQKADEVIFSSDWAKNDAVNYYGISSKKIHVLPFGANLKDEYQLSKKTINSTIHLLFCGVDWERKGADIALECLKILNKSDKKRKYDLTIIGLNAPKGSHYDNVTFVGRLNKNLEADYAKMITYYRESDVFILPTKAECAGIVFAEAAMYGLPVFTYITGCTTTYVCDKVTGRCLPLGASPADFATAIQEMFDHNMYHKYSIQARNYYEENLNWGKWLSAFKKIAKK